MTCPKFLDSPNPRIRSCARCGIPPERHAAPEQPGYAPRDLKLEAHLMDIASRAAGYFDAEGKGDDGGLSRHADSRAWPIGIRESLDGIKEIGEEYADARNYAVMAITLIWDQVVAGDPDALDDYSRLMGSLAGTVAANHKLQHVPS